MLRYLDAPLPAYEHINDSLKLNDCKSVYSLGREQKWLTHGFPDDVQQRKL